MSTSPLMPKATAVWLVENTSLTFEQIAAFCGLHPLEVKGIADGEVAVGIKGQDPVMRGELSRDEIDKAQHNPAHVLKVAERKVRVPDLGKRMKGPRYTPVSRRQDRPNAILWLLRNHGELSDAQIIRLVGTTKSTIQQIKDRSHWNMTNLGPMDPVTLGLCSQIDLDLEVNRAAKGRPPQTPVETGPTLLAAETTTAPQEPFAHAPRPAPKSEDKIDAESVFSKLKHLNLEEDQSNL